MLRSTFTTLNPQNQTILHGQIWQPQNPEAVIVLVHGLGEHCRRYDDFSQHICARNIALVSLDLHGHGRTRGPRGIADDLSIWLADIDALLAKARQNFPKLPLFLMGHSMGGGLVLRYGFENQKLPIQGVIAQAPLIRPSRPIPKPLYWMLNLLAKLAPKARVNNRFKGSDISTLPKQAAAYEADLLNHGYLGLSIGKQLFDSGENIYSTAQKFPYPLLMTHTQNDKLTSFETAKDFAIRQKASFIAFENSGHEIHNDRYAEKLASDLTEFIRPKIT